MKALFMTFLEISAFSVLTLAVSLLSLPPVAAQAGTEIAAENSDVHSTAHSVAHAFSATKYARLVRVMPDGRLHFIRNERYPTRIARAADGRVMMQYVDDDIPPECDRPTMRIPPQCPYWSVFVIDPNLRLASHWPEGEFAAHVSVDFPLSSEDVESMVRSTTDLPDLEPDPDTDAASVRKEDLGEREIDGIRAHGVRTTITYRIGHEGNTVSTLQIHELWIAPENKLIIRVIDGDPRGLERIWGLEKVSLHPDPSLFSPPNGYELQHQRSSWGASIDFEALESWFKR